MLNKTSDQRSAEQAGLDHPHSQIHFGRVGWRWVIIALLGVTFLNGVVFSLLSPPWYIPDEPGHYEYIQIWAHRGGLPRPGDITPQQEAPIIRSLVRVHFWRNIGLPDPKPVPTLMQQDALLSISGNQIGHQPPLYSLLLLPTFWATNHLPLEIQLRLLRLTSVLFLVLAVGVAALAGRTLFPGDLPLACSIPFFLAFQPMANFMSAGVNNDSLYILGSTLVTYTLIRLFRYGLSFRRVSAASAALAFCIAAKSGGLVLLVPLTATLVILGLRSVWLRFPRSHRYLSVGGGALLALGSIIGLGTYAPSAWVAYSLSGQVEPHTQSFPGGKGGVRLIAFANAPEPTNACQYISRQQWDNLKGQPVRAAFWARWHAYPIAGAQAPTIGFIPFLGNVEMPEIRGVIHTAEMRQVLSPAPDTWQYYSWQVSLPVTVLPPRWCLHAYPLAQSNVEVELSGNVFTPGLLPVGEPRFLDSGCRTGVWGGALFINQIRDGCGAHLSVATSLLGEHQSGLSGALSRGVPAHASGARLGAALEKIFPLAQAMIQVQGSTGLQGLKRIWTDPSGYIEYLRDNGNIMVFLWRSFWAFLGWNSRPVGDWWYVALTVLTRVGIAGLVLFWMKTKFWWQRWAVGCMVLAFVSNGVVVLLHNVPFSFPYEPQSSGRYLFASIVPFGIFVMAGLRALVPTRWEPAWFFTLGLWYVCLVGAVITSLIILIY